MADTCLVQLPGTAFVLYYQVYLALMSEKHYLCTIKKQKQMRELYLRPGMIINNGSVIIKDEDRLCYLVRAESKGAAGVRTISKSLLAEFISYIKTNPNASSQEARLHLSGKSEIDRFEYGYNATLVQMAKQAIMLENQLISNQQKIENWLLKSSQTALYIPILSALRTKPSSFSPASPAQARAA